MKARIARAVSIILLTALFVIPSFKQAMGKELKIGVLQPLTGYISYLGQRQEAALKVALKEFQEMGPVAGLDLKFILYDTGSKPQDAILMAQKLMHTDKVLCIIGPTLSSEAEQVFPVCNRDKVPIITPSSALPGLTAANRPWTFRNMMTSDKADDPCIRLWVRDHKIKTAAIISDAKSKVTEAYGKVVAPALLKKYGVRVVEAIDVLTEDVDFSAQVTRVKAANPDGIVVSAEHHIGANIAREIRKQGLMQPLVGDVFLHSSDYIRLGGPAVVGTYTVTSFWEGNPDPKVQAFRKSFKERYRAEHNMDVEPDEANSGVYDTAYIVRYLVEKMGFSGVPQDLQKDREKMRNGWATLTNYNGVQGRTSIDKNGDAEKDYYTLVLRNGEWQLVRE